jgi:hypothetical protein
MGIEPPANSPENTTLSPEGGAKSGSAAVEIRPIDPDLARVVTAWPELPEAIRRAVLALVNSTAG